MASRFFRPNSTVDDSVNSDRFKSFVDRIKKWGGESPGMATPMDVTGYNSIFQPGYSPSNYGGTRPQEMPTPVQAVEHGIPEAANQTSFPLSDAFYMKNGRLYASDTVAGYSKEHRRGLLDEYLKRFPDAQAGVDAWSKRTPSGTKASATGVKRPHPGTPSTSGDWTSEQKPISAPTPTAQPAPIAQPAPVRASGGPRGGVPVGREAWMAPVAIPAATESSYGGVDEYAAGATKKYRDDYARMQRRGNLSLSPAPDEYKTRFDEGMEPAADLGLMFAGGGKAGAAGVGFVERAMAKRAAAAAAKADDAYFAAKEAERLKRGLAASARWRRAQYAATEAEVRRAALRRNAEPFWRASENNRNWRAYTRPGD